MQVSRRKNCQTGGVTKSARRRNDTGQDALRLPRIPAGFWFIYRPQDGPALRHSVDDGDLLARDDAGADGGDRVVAGVGGEEG